MFGNNLEDHKQVITAAVKIFAEVDTMQFTQFAEVSSEEKLTMSSILEPINRLKKLQYLVTFLYSCYEIAGVCVPTLKNLKMYFADCELQYLETFISSNSKIEKISIDFNTKKYDDHRDLPRVRDLIEYSLKHLKIVSMRFAIKTREDIQYHAKIFERIQKSIDEHALDGFEKIEFWNRDCCEYCGNQELFVKLEKNKSDV